jgi:hypothetical protein
MQLFHKILPETRKLTMNKYGSRVVQTAFSYITQEQHAEWTKARAFFTHTVGAYLGRRGVFRIGVILMQIRIRLKF